MSVPLKRYPAFEQALTKPLTAEESSPQMSTEVPPRIAFKGNYQDVNRFFYRKGWGDGLPIVPPTEEAVAEMLTGTDLPADHVVATVIPRHGKATIEKIAINAVMAGALPTHLPVIIAAVESFANQKTRFDTFEVSTGSWAPFFAVNGPIRDQIHLNYGSGALSPGDITNAAIGRAVGLVVKNIGAARKGIEDMGVIGNPMKYSLVLGENQEESPWEPLSVERGFQKGENTLTVFFPNSYMQAVPTETDAQGLASAMQKHEPLEHVLLCGHSFTRQNTCRCRVDEGKTERIHFEENGFSHRRLSWKRQERRYGGRGHPFSSAECTQYGQPYGPGRGWTGRLDGTASKRRRY